MRSHAPTSPVAPATEAGWDAEATQFAITTVNVPDRLDLQEERDRAELEEYAEERRRTTLRVWMKRLLVVAVFAVFGAALYGMLKPLRDDTSPAQVAERLSQALKRPVTVAETDFNVSPSPRLVLRGVDVGGEFSAGEISLLINWKDLWSALRGGQWVWGEATVAPLTMTPAQALAAVRLVPGGAAGLPNKISTIRLESVRIADSMLFPARYEGVLRRGDDGKFGPLVLKQLDADNGAMQLRFRPAAADGGVEATAFDLDAERWLPPVGPRVRWNEVRASGRIGADFVEVTNFSLAGFFGVTTGTLRASTTAPEWTVAGTVGASNVDVESVLQSLRGKGQATREEQAPAMQGTANLQLAIAGRGATLDQAIQQATLSGPFQVRWATLNGINLGLAATQGATAAGTTRFTDFDGTVTASSGGLRFDDVGGRAGALSARAAFAVAADRALSGTVRVELGGQTVQAPITLRVSGSIFDPRFGK